MIRNERKIEHKILVPFCYESALSGVMERLGDGAKMIYSRDFVVNSDWAGKRIKLVFEAVDYEAKVMVNGIEVGSHTGGYDSFSFDITDVLMKNYSQQQTITVIAKDSTEKRVSHSSYKIKRYNLILFEFRVYKYWINFNCILSLTYILGSSSWEAMVNRRKVNFLHSNLGNLAICLVRTCSREPCRET